MIVKMVLFGKGAWLKEINQHRVVGELNEPQGRLGWILFLGNDHERIPISSYVMD